MGSRWGMVIPELFSIPGESKREIFHSLMRELPDMLILMLLFVPRQVGVLGAIMYNRRP